MRTLAAFALATFAVGCGADESLPTASDAGAGLVADAGIDTVPDAGLDAGSTSETPDGGTTACPAGVVCVDAFPFTHDDDTTLATSANFDHYSCAPTTNESGNERVYRVTVHEPGFLMAAVREAPGVDVDVHVLSAFDASSCVDRGNFHARADVTPGTWWIVVDTFVNAAGQAQAGAYSVDIGFLRPSEGACGLETGVMPRVHDNGNSLAMPATGKIVKEAHLVTREEPAPYPATETDELAAHYALSQARTGFVMHRAEPWAPLEGGSFYGAGIGDPSLFPVEHEAWYVNMYWTSAARPARGTRMILRKPGTTRAVVVAAGYETGPGDLSFVAGTPEETHHYLGTSHGSTLTVGIATDQTLPFGPRTCSP